jgi:hypothetical protein
LGIGDLGPIPKEEKKLIIKIVLLNNYLLNNKEILKKYFISFIFLNQS